MTLTQITQQCSEILGKNFGFPKMHYLLVHAFEHVKRKGATKVTTTTIGEHGHVELKGDATRTNFVTLERQVCTVDSLTLNLGLLTCNLIQITKIQERKDILKIIRRKVNKFSNTGGPGALGSTRPSSTRVISPKRPKLAISFETNQGSHPRSRVFRLFNSELRRWLAKQMVEHGWRCADEGEFAQLEGRQMVSSFIQSIYGRCQLLLFRLYLTVQYKLNSFHCPIIKSLWSFFGVQSSFTVEHGVIYA
jgi:hypothetical protein